MKKHYLFIVGLMVALVVIVSFYVSLNLDGDDENTDLLKQQVTEKIKAFKLKKLIRQRDLILKKENFTQISNYQQYVTPGAQGVVSFIAQQAIITRKQGYEAAVDWVLVSDQILHGQAEKNGCFLRCFYKPLQRYFQTRFWEVSLVIVNHRCIPWFRFLRQQVFPMKMFG